MRYPDVKWNEQPDQRTGCSRAWDIIITTEGPSQQVLSSIEIPQDAFRLISPADFIDILPKHSNQRYEPYCR